VTLVIDKFSQKVAKKNEDSIANGVCLKEGHVQKTSLFRSDAPSASLGGARYPPRREEEPEKETGD
jgi:hypothetical protein